MTAVEPLDKIDVNNDAATSISTTIPNFNVYEIVDIQNNTKELKELGMYPLQFNPVNVVNKGRIEAIYAAQVDICLAVGEKKTLKDTHDKMVQKLQYGEV